ncbi:MAG: regulatory protein RecX [Candidatus Omnitrophica bacterium]|nr:regulatory protein RecX [Candidatus Omnitrophota bacterium]
MKRNSDEKAMAYACRLLSLRLRSEAELKERLALKGFARVVVENVVSVLKNKKIVDDLRFAKAWVESRMRTNPKGSILLKRELKKKGIEDSLIAEAMPDKKDGEDKVAATIARRKFETLKNMPRAKARKKLFDFLARRGFDFGIIEETLNELFSNTD